MTCVPLPGGGLACTRGERRPRCSVPSCGGVAPFVCDYELALDLVGGAPTTCDAKLCTRHARIQPGKAGADGSAMCHYCPPHHERALKETR